MYASRRLTIQLVGTHRHSSRLAACSFFFSAIMLVGVCHSQTAETAADNVSSSIPADEIHRRRHALADRIERLEQLASSPESTAGQPTAVVAANELKLLRSLDMLYLHLQTADSQTEEARRLRDQFREELAALEANSTGNDPAVSWLVLDDRRDRLDAESARERLRTTDVELARSALDVAISSQEQVERQRRRVIDESSAAADGERAKHEYRLRMADLESTVAATTVSLRRIELTLRRSQLEAAESHRRLLEAQVARMRSRATFSQSDFQQRQKELTAYFADIASRLERAQNRLREIDVLATSDTLAAQRVDRDRTAATGDSTAKSNTVDWSAETRLFIHSVCHEEVLELERRVGDAQVVRDSALARFKLHNGRLTELEIAEWYDTCERINEQFDVEERRLTNRIGDLLQDLTTIHRESRLRSSGGEMGASQGTGDAKESDERGSAPTNNQGLPTELQVRGAQLESLLRTLEFSQRHILALRRALGRFQSDLSERLPSTAKTSWFEGSLAWGATAWNYELMAVGDQSITVSKITRGAIGFVVGLLVAAAVSRLLGRRVLPRIGLNHGASEALRTLSFYSLCLLFGVLSLEFAHVPLTAFTFMGGAIAIGVGFGSQNILNNFISGLILLAEQPIRVRDLVEIGDLHGTVERIGARSTTIRTGANAEIVVPNSKLLEDNVTNLTRSDDRFRTSIAVGVAYGSPIAEVKRCLLESAKHPAVLEDPRPFVLFADFADSTLNFELHFWVRLASMTACRQVASDIRESIDAAFRESGIEMAFPQRDLHLTTARPLEFQLVRHESQRVRRAA